MALVNMYGFNHVNQGVQADGVTPIDGIGLQDSGYNLIYGSISTTSSVTAMPAFCHIGVVSDPNQAMGKAPKRQPIVLRQNGDALATASGIPANCGFKLINGTSLGSGGAYFGFRFAWDYDGNAATITNGQTNGNINIVFWETPQQSQILVQLFPLTQQIQVIGSTFSLPPGTECYIELFVANLASVVMQGRFNGNPVTTRTGVNQGGTSSHFSLGMVGNTAGHTFVTPQNSGQWGLLKFCDIYVANSAGDAPWNTFLGPVKIFDAPFDVSVSNSMSVSPSGITPVEAIADPNDGDVLVTTDTASEATFGYSSLPAGVDEQVLAIQSVVTASKDSGFSQSLAFTDSANGTTGTSVPITLPGTDPVITLGTLRTALADGTALTASTFTDYQLQITSTP